ncbi:hypothetical protein V5799_025439 [Amblyomma americanum]|uniref:Uncharacterized protein n=1 Tax=Amblyomma americanum TaxID=6943 RepID=A0AAQ4E9K9_AMBAM
METVDLVKRSQQLEEKLLKSKCLTCPLFEAHFEQEHRRQRLSEEVRHLQHQLSEDSLASMPDYRNHVLALERLGYVEPSGTLTLKGRVARSLSSYEVMLSDLLLQESLLTLGAPEVAGLFSCLVYEQRSNSEAVVPRSVKAEDTFWATLRIRFCRGCCPRTATLRPTGSFGWRHSTMRTVGCALL